MGRKGGGGKYFSASSVNAHPVNPGAISLHLDLCKPRHLQKVAQVVEREASALQAVPLAAHLIQRRQQHARVEGQPPGEGAGLAGHAQHRGQPQRQRGGAWLGQRPMAQW